MTKVSASVLESFAPSFGILGLPYLFRDRAHRFAVLDGVVGRRLLLSAEGRRLRGLAFYDAGSRSFYTRSRPVERPEDLAGLKIRTQESASAMAMVAALGGSPTPISWGELYTALQQGVVDGAENNPPSFYTSRHFEVAPFYSLDEHTAVPDVLLVGRATWQRLDAEERAWLEEAALASARYERQLWRQAEDEALRALRDAGVEISSPDKAAFAAKAAPLLEKLRGDAELGSLIAAIEAVQSGAPPGEAPEETQP
jgi:tripartite ATP-independent transporter DctP family solute receptor